MFDANITERPGKYFHYALTGIVLFCSISSRAQLCNGSLGDAIVNIDFGAGQSLNGTQLGSSTTSYAYTTASFPNDGSYTIENTTAGAGSVWWPTTDHTGNAGGYMMVVNASISTTDYFYKSTVTGLCGATTYEFAAWIINLLKSTDKSPPNITFMIETPDGALLNSYSTGSIPLTAAATWKQFGFYFTTPQNVSTVVIRMRNNSAGGAPANDLALDDITFRACGATVKTSIAGTSQSADTVCAGVNSLLILQGTLSSGYTSPKFQWQVNTGSGWQDLVGNDSIVSTISIENTPPGTYLYRLAVGEGANFASLPCRVYSNDIKITIQQKPAAAYLIKSDTACTAQPVYFTDQTNTGGGLTYKWSFGDGTSSSEKNPSHVYANSGTYFTSLMISTSNGCKDSAALQSPVKVSQTPEVTLDVSPHETSIYYPEITIISLSGNGSNCSVSWGDGTLSNCSTYSHSYASAGTFTISQNITSSNGCTGRASQVVVISPEYSFFIPNIFTPNGDGLNDVFLPVVNAVGKYSFMVFDRWGNKIFETNEVTRGWDGSFKGKACPKEIYVYKISLTDAVSGTPHVYTGTVFLYLEEYITQQ